MSPGTWEQGHNLPQGRRHSLPGSPTSPLLGQETDSQAALLGDSFGEMGELLRRGGPTCPRPLLVICSRVPQGHMSLMDLRGEAGMSHSAFCPPPPQPPALQSGAEMAPSRTPMAWVCPKRGLCCPPPGCV